MREQAKQPGERLEAVADWFTEAKNLWLERLPVGLIADLRAGAAALRAQAWQPIATAPTGILVLVYYREGGMTTRRKQKSGQWIDVLGNNAGEPMLWMPLPLPPAGPQEPR